MSEPAPLLLSVQETARLLGIGTTLAYKLVTSGEILTVRLGDRRLVPQSWLNNYIKELEAKANAVLDHEDAEELVAAGE